jgi:hypothetical protein
MLLGAIDLHYDAILDDNVERSKTESAQGFPNLHKFLVQIGIRQGAVNDIGISGRHCTSSLLTIDTSPSYCDFHAIHKVSVRD